MQLRLSSISTSSVATRDLGLPLPHCQILLNYFRWAGRSVLPILALQWFSSRGTSKELTNCFLNLRPQSLSLFVVQHHYILFLPKTVFLTWLCHFSYWVPQPSYLLWPVFHHGLLVGAGDNTFFNLPFLFGIPAEALSVTLCVLCQFQLYLCLPHPSSTQPDLISILFPRSPVLTSSVYAFVSCPLVWPAGPYSAMLVSCLNSCSWKSLALVFNGRLP